MTADHAREAVHGQHGSLAGAAAGDHKVSRPTAKQDGTQDTTLDIGELSLIIRSIHSVIIHGMAHGFYHFFSAARIIPFLPA